MCREKFSSWWNFTTMKKTMMLLAVVATSATLRVVGEVIWPGGNVKVVAGNCAKVETKGDVVYLTSTESQIGRAHV